MAIIDRGITRSHRKSKMFISICLMIVLATSLMTISFLKLQESESDQLESPAPAGITYTTRDYISINGNGEFNGSNGVASGSGTASDPYIIEDWDIKPFYASEGIVIRNTDAHFIIRNCYIHDGTSYEGIFLYNVVNGTLSNNICSNNYQGIYLWSSSNNTLFNNTCSFNNFMGIHLKSSSDNNTLSNNTCNWNDWHGINIEDSSNNILSSNICNSNTYWGIELLSLSNKNILIGNICISNNDDGICLSRSNSNTLVYNNLSSNYNYGIYLWSSSNNRIWNNTFINNNGAMIQAGDAGTNNWWNSSDGYGNYWSDWTTPDDVPPWGIVDNPYNIDGSAGAKDYYPQTTAPIIPEPPIFILTGIMMMIFLIFGRTRKKDRKEV